MTRKKCQKVPDFLFTHIDHAGEIYVCFLVERKVFNYKSYVHTVREGLQLFEHAKETFEKEMSLKEEEVMKLQFHSPFQF